MLNIADHKIVSKFLSQIEKFYKNLNILKIATKNFFIIADILFQRKIPNLKSIYYRS